MQIDLKKPFLFYSYHWKFQTLIFSRTGKYLSLHLFTDVSLQQIFFSCQRLAQNLRTPPNTMEDLKFVLGTIAEIREVSLSVELKYLDIQERYRTLTMYNIPVSEVGQTPCFIPNNFSILKGATESCDSPNLGILFLWPGVQVLFARQWWAYKCKDPSEVQRWEGGP